MADGWDNTDDFEARLASNNVLAQNMEPALRAKQLGALESFRDDLEKDKQTYVFKAVRWGDFLALFIQRGEVRDQYYFGSTPTNKHVAALNIATSREIVLSEGRAPDLSGVITFYLSYASNPNKEVRAMEPSIPWKRLLTLKQPSEHFGGMLQSSSRDCVTHRMEGCARPSEDDTIYFNGPNATLYVPFGRGAEIYAAILQAIKDGEK